MDNKEKIWQKEKEKLGKIADNLGMPIDEGIKDAIVGLKLLGFETDGSCEGHINQEGVGGPWVDLTSEEIKALEPEREKIFEESLVKGESDLNEEARRRVDEIDAKKLKIQARAINLLAEFYANRKSIYDVMIIVAPIINGRIQCMGTDVANILPKKEQKKKLKEYRQEFNNFTEFLKDKFFEKD